MNVLENSNLLKAIELMLFLTDEQPFGEKIKKINFKTQWWKKFHWTAKDQEKFMTWFTDYLKTNWKGIVDTKPSTIKLRQRITDEFVLSYSPITRPLKSSDFMSVVPFSQLDEVMSKEEREEFNKWMFGQTTPLYGVYRGDLERWLNKLPVID